MEMSFECPVCFEQFSTSIKPLLIPCGHTACEKCLQSLIKAKELECPVCRSIHHNLLVNSLSTNFALIQSESSKPSSSLIQRLEELHQQQSNLSSLKDLLSSNFQKSNHSLSQHKSEIQQKQDFLTNLISSHFKSLLSQLDSNHQHLLSTYEKLDNQISTHISTRQDLISGLEQTYSSNTEIPTAIRLQLASLTFPSISPSLPQYTYKSQNFDFNDKILSFLGSIEIEPQLKSPDPSSQMVQMIQMVPNSPVLPSSQVNQFSQVKQPNPINPIKPINSSSNLNLIDADQQDLRKNEVKGRGRGRVDANPESAKQPRQPKIEANIWHVKNRFGQWEKLPNWFDGQIKAAAEQGSNVVNITNLSGKVEYQVNLKEKVSYRLTKHGQVGRGNPITIGLV